MKTCLHPQGAALFAGLAAFALTAVGLVVTDPKIGQPVAWLTETFTGLQRSEEPAKVVLPTLTDITPKTFTEGQMVVGADGDYLTVKDLPPVVAVFGTGIYPAMPSQVIEWTGPDDADSHNVG
jgi:hypothetical protein